MIRASLWVVAAQLLAEAGRWKILARARRCGRALRGIQGRAEDGDPADGDCCPRPWSRNRTAFPTRKADFPIGRRNRCDAA